MSNAKKLAVVIATAALVSSANAALMNPGSWVRGATNSLYAEWDVFSGLTDNSPDVGNVNVASASMSEISGTSILSAGNIYAYIDANRFTLSVMGDSYGPVAGDSARVYLTIFSRGTVLDTSNVKLSGVSAESTVLLSSMTFGAGFGFTEDTWLFSWNTEGVANWSFDFQSVGPGLSLAAVAIDIQTVAAPQVPIPATVWLMGSGLIGLSALYRRPKA
jgi:hypothetical protein